jgi:hypothetical protein
MKKHSTFYLRRAVSRRIRKPLSRRDVRALLSAADRDAFNLDLVHVSTVVEEQG